jgi:hypothetical protein
MQWPLQLIPMLIGNQHCWVGQVAVADASPLREAPIFGPPKKQYDFSASSDKYVFSPLKGNSGYYIASVKLISMADAKRDSAKGATLSDAADKTVDVITHEFTTPIFQIDELPNMIEDLSLRCQTKILKKKISIPEDNTFVRKFTKKFHLRLVVDNT